MTYTVVPYLANRTYCYRSNLSQPPAFFDSCILAVVAVTNGAQSVGPNSAQDSIEDGRLAKYSDIMGAGVPFRPIERAIHGGTKLT